MTSYIEPFNEGQLAALRFLAKAVRDAPDSNYSGDISYFYLMDMIETRYEEVAERPMWCTCNATHTCEGHRA